MIFLTSTGLVIHAFKYHLFNLYITINMKNEQHSKEHFA